MCSLDRGIDARKRGLLSLCTGTSRALDDGASILPIPSNAP